MGWGFGLFTHGMEAFGYNPIWGKRWEEKKLRELMDKEDFYFLDLAVGSNQFSDVSYQLVVMVYWFKQYISYLLPLTSYLLPLTSYLLPLTFTLTLHPSHQSIHKKLQFGNPFFIKRYSLMIFECISN